MSRFQKHIEAAQQHLALTAPITTEQRLLAALAHCVAALAISVNNMRSEHAPAAPARPVPSPEGRDVP